jgi:hypothetical protein
MMMEAAHTSHTSVYFNDTTWRYVPEGSDLHTRRRENMKSHPQCVFAIQARPVSSNFSSLQPRTFQTSNIYQ